MAKIQIENPASAAFAASHDHRMTNPMTKILLALILITALSCGTGSTQENLGSANYIMKGCRDHLTQSESNYFGRGNCSGLLEGIAYADPMVCIPNGVTLGQIVRVVVQSIDQQPARLHEHFRDLAREVLRRTWPCKAVPK